SGQFMKNQSVRNHIDWISVFLYILLVLLGWVNIYSSSLPVDGDTAFDFAEVYGKQLVFIILTIPLIVVILALDGKFYEKYAVIFFAVSLLLLAGLFVFGKE